MLTEGMDAFARLVWARFVLLGWPTAELMQAFDGAYDTILIEPAFRFWRGS